ncbi:TPA: hypothetical protein ACH3X2_010422 [Trebouxia sp. C0005]
MWVDYCPMQAMAPQEQHPAQPQGQHATQPHLVQHTHVQPQPVQAQSALAQPQAQHTGTAQVTQAVQPEAQMRREMWSGLPHTACHLASLSICCQEQLACNPVEFHPQALQQQHAQHPD